MKILFVCAFCALTTLAAAPTVKTNIPVRTKAVKILTDSQRIANLEARVSKLEAANNPRANLRAVTNAPAKRMPR